MTSDAKSELVKSVSIFIGGPQNVKCKLKDIVFLSDIDDKGWREEVISSHWTGTFPSQSSSTPLLPQQAIRFICADVTCHGGVAPPSGRRDRRDACAVSRAPHADANGRAVTMNRVDRLIAPFGASPEVRKSRGGARRPEEGPGVFDNTSLCKEGIKAQELLYGLYSERGPSSKAVNNRRCIPRNHPSRRDSARPGAGRGARGVGLANEMNTTSGTTEH
ncbi:unnamed protein product [Chrysodeixis includens]|uniref:Uncharacterized protein n=1 Tax=Chrysodeixis includens TaxID=689277 RepID=A0A9N8L2P7_CHRIL|nr:unnamed protein product [Chrysodeixis includens]